MHLADKPIRVELVRFDDGGWIPYYCTDPNATVRDILEVAADHWAIKEHFHYVKEIWGAGQQQVRNVWSNIGCWHLNQWLHTLVELASWGGSLATLVNRTARSWDNANATRLTPTAAANWPCKSCTPNFLRLYPRHPKPQNTSPLPNPSSASARDQWQSLKVQAQRD